MRKMRSPKITALLLTASLAIGIAGGLLLGSGRDSAFAGSGAMQQALAALGLRSLVLGTAGYSGSQGAETAGSGASGGGAGSGEAGGPGENARRGSGAKGHNTMRGRGSSPAGAQGSSGASGAVSGEAGSPSESGSADPEGKGSAGAGNGSGGSGGSGKGGGSGEDAGSAGRSTGPERELAKLPHVEHVWLVTLAQTSLDAALEHRSRAPYLSHQLATKGLLLRNYRLDASSELANGIVLLSGQVPNALTEKDCPSYVELQPPTVNPANGLAVGSGCVYPHAVQTLPDELAAAGLSWRAYVQGMGAPCSHPQRGAAQEGEAQGPSSTPASTGAYRSSHNPFVYFHSLLDSGACAADDLDLSRLAGELSSPGGPPSLSWIVPSACEDGSNAPCSSGAASGIGAADRFLAHTLAPILASNAYRQGGLIAIVPDSGKAHSRVGALLFSPFVRAGVRIATRFDDYSLLASLARLFGVLPLGHAGDAGTSSFGAAVYRSG
jgi:phosphatidylinositol-3-phosphatase